MSAYNFFWALGNGLGNFLAIFYDYVARYFNYFLLYFGFAAFIFWMFWQKRLIDKAKNDPDQLL
ncbi:MAG TPA: hypothetical protein PLP27_02390 [Crocinitomicaceae bacterium]|nr:hypothetical protein [Crocinitomicaceae bacterium]